ncbi:MAG: NUDIX domain-containing protein [Candidatus Paceibacterota bacterium]|jgi:mutator protein MutT
MRKNQRAGVAIKQGEKFLLIKRKKGNDIYYILPGGGVESGETPKQAAIREVKEELGIDVIIDKKIADFKHRGNTEFYFLSKDFNGEIKLVGDGVFNSNITDTEEWVLIEDLHKINLLPEKIKNILIRLFTQT